MRTYLGCVICCTEDQLGCPVVARADVGHIGLVLYQYLGAAKVAQLQHAGAGVEQKVLRLDVTMADAL